MAHPQHLFHLYSSFCNSKVARSIRTWIVIVEGKVADHYTSTTAQCSQIILDLFFCFPSNQSKSKPNKMKKIVLGVFFSTEATVELSFEPSPIPISKRREESKEAAKSRNIFGAKRFDPTTFCRVTFCVNRVNLF